MKNFKLKSKNLDELTECIKNLILKENINVIRNPIMEADEEFTSVVQADDMFDPTKINSNIVTTEDNANDEKEAEKTELLSKAKEEIEKSLENSESLRDILKQIKELNDDIKLNEWEVNEEGNTAILSNKNAQIFLQNNNICLSYRNVIDCFDTVDELHKALINKGLPLPKNIKLHEAVEENNEQIDPIEINIEKLKNKWPGLRQAAFDILMGNDVREIIKRENSKSTPDTNKEPNAKKECFGGTGVGALGSAVQYTAKPLDEEEELEEVKGPENTWLANHTEKKTYNMAQKILEMLHSPSKFIAKDSSIQNQPMKLTKETFEKALNDYKNGGYAVDLGGYAVKGYYDKSTSDHRLRNTPRKDDLIDKRNRGLDGAQRYKAFKNLTDEDIELMSIFENIFDDNGYAIDKEKLRARLEILKNFGLDFEIDNMREIKEFDPQTKKDIIIEEISGKNKYMLEKYKSMIKNISLTKMYPENRKTMLRAIKAWDYAQNKGIQDGDDIAPFVIEYENKKLTAKNLSGYKANEEKLADYLVNMEVPEGNKEHWQILSDLNTDVLRGSFIKMYNQAIDDSYDDKIFIKELKNIKNKVLDEQKFKILVNTLTSVLKDNNDVYTNEVTENEMKKLLESSQTSFVEKIKNIFNSPVDLKEDESPEDFAAPTEDAGVNEVDTPDLSNETDDSEEISMNDFAGSEPDVGSDISMPSGGFGYSPNVENLEGEPEQAPLQPEDEFQIIDVLMNNSSNPEIRLKVKNLNTGEIEIKNLSEIDV